MAAPSWTDLPIPDETADLRSGPDLHPALLPLLPLVGVWRGSGRGGYPTIEDFDYGQQVVFAHDGRPVLRYESRSWILSPEGEVVRPAAREVGWWRPGAGDGDLEVLLAHPTGIVEVYVGDVAFHRIDLVSDLVARTATAKPVSGMKRLYGLVEGDLAYAVDMAAVDQPLQAHFSAKLSRVS